MDDFEFEDYHPLTKICRVNLEKVVLEKNGKHNERDFKENMVTKTSNVIQNGSSDKNSARCSFCGEFISILLMK